MRTSRKSSLAAMLVCLPVLLGCTTASAATVTYNFSESGWVNTFGTTENLFGSFTGTPEKDGTLVLTSLSSFSAVITETNATGDSKNVAEFTGAGALTDFMYVPQFNSLTLAAAGSPASMICLGDAVAAGFCGALPARAKPKPGAPPLPPIEGLFSFSVNGALNAYTTNLPAVTLVQDTGLLPVHAQAPATVPEPASLALCGIALVLLAKGLNAQGRKSAARRQA